MAEGSFIPGYEAAIASERRDRAIPFCGIKERIGGVECNALTPLLLEWLRVCDNAFICGGDASPEAIVQFMWIVSPLFSQDAKAKEAWLDALKALDLEKARADIDAMLGRAFLDTPHGRAGTPYTSVAAMLVHAMAGEPFRWSMEQTMNTPLAIIYQLTKADAQARGHTVINARSSKVESDWMGQLEMVTGKTESAIKKAVEKKRKEGWMTVSTCQPQFDKKTRKFLYYAVQMAPRPHGK